MNCEICDYGNGKIKTKKLYEDSDMMAILSPTPATFGHAIVFPKKHFTILMQIPDDVVKRMFFVAQQIAGIIYEAVCAEGTNIIINEGVPAGQRHAHAIIHIIPRKRDDGLSFEWAQKQIPEDSMAKIYELLRVPQETEVKKPVEYAKEQEALKTESATDVKEYLLRQLRRVP